MSGGRKAPRERGNDSPITAARLAAGMTQAQLAAAIGCLGKDVSRWEHGTYKPRIETLRKMAEVLNCSMEDLL